MRLMASHNYVIDMSEFNVLRWCSLWLQTRLWVLRPQI